MPISIWPEESIPDEDKMGEVHERLDDKLVEFIGRRHLFFVGTAPDSPEDHLNLSPKGLDIFRILPPNSVAHFDLTGGAVETVAVPRLD